MMSGLLLAMKSTTMPDTSETIASTELNASISGSAIAADPHRCGRPVAAASASSSSLTRTIIASASTWF
jgi:hypothetical protein